MLPACYDAGDTKLCAGNGQVDTCNGDSGGALLSDKQGVSEYLVYSTVATVIVYLPAMETVVGLSSQTNRG